MSYLGYWKIIHPDWRIHMRSVGVLIVGAGASGLMAAIGAKKYTKNVLIIDKLNQPGKKILATGNGRCNYTNYCQKPEFYHSSENGFAWSIIKRFGYKDTIDIFSDMGIMPVDRDGYVYPASGQAVSVRNVLRRELEKKKTEIHLEERVIDIEEHVNSKTGEKDGYIVSTDKDKYLAKKVILTTGGKAAPVHGSDGDGYTLGSKLGHSISRPVPALTSCVIGDKFSKDWTGIRVKGKVTAYDEKEHELASDTGELQMISYGISGIPVFQISRYISLELSKGCRPYIVMDIMPLYDMSVIIDEIKKRIYNYPDGSIADIFEGMLHQKLTSALLNSCGISPAKKACEIHIDDIEKIAGKMKSWRLNVTDTGDFTKAQVTCGGISTEEINADTMESKIAGNLYFAGELVDVDAICGGYNLQWAWSSGYIAGTSAGKAVADIKKRAAVK